MNEEKRKKLGLAPQFNALKPGQQVQVDLKNATQRVCDECGCKYFQPAVMIYTVSALVSPTGQELMAQQPALICLECRKPLGKE
ncbi:MAG TPA: hypothetical protein VMW95_02685 [Desulfobacterales bacterium]|nr:hypothetical protein [Desulfobacterales bacterium]